MLELKKKLSKNVTLLKSTTNNYALHNIMHVTIFLTQTKIRFYLKSRAGILLFMPYSRQDSPKTRQQRIGKKGYLR